MKELVFLILCCCTLTACGVKPGAVEPPEGSAPSGYPLTYPDLKTDYPPKSGD